eukprot:NODE_225_length_13912_cov_0.499674.p8 type:complete len:100 gc:universal NODE_225_length_13912_cov_0.499674:4262-3963(-)
MSTQICKQFIFVIQSNLEKVTSVSVQKRISKFLKPVRFVRRKKNIHVSTEIVIQWNPTYLRLYSFHACKVFPSIDDTQRNWIIKRRKVRYLIIILTFIF